ncbi:UNVERIFIED_CONTAM: putative ribonuclease H protein [Sesamum radiatum]|uniref:Ribonuclease H protein n=1 Tax=Sesamum radiatum TaxID=300843 RepID=A0AAW2U6C8_SESRA
MINALIFLNAEPRPWQFTGVHCPAVSVLKPIFWHSFNEICHSFDGPWLAMGDFNAVMSQTEKRGGKPFASASRNALGNEFDVCNLIDLGFTGASFTWSNKRPAPSRYSVRSLPLLLDTHPSNRNRPKPFFFEDMWCRDFSCETLIADVWLSYVSGNPILRLHNLLKLLRGELRKWNRRTFGWCQERISSIKQHLETLQESAQTVEVIEMENNLQLELDEQLKRVETKWKQKAKQRWLEDGDANTKYFHMTAVLQSRANHIHSIQTREGNAVTDWELIGDIQNSGKQTQTTPPENHLPAPNGFCPRADAENAQTVRQCLAKFENWSSQTANNRKSFVHFSGNVPNRQRRILLDILQMPECNHRAKHLGLPFCKPPSRNHISNELIEKLSKKLSLWKAKNLSRAGKMVLIKNVAQAIPVYQMSTYLLPKKICHQLDSTVRRFWWKTTASEEKNQFLALKSWNSICQPKSKGGLGFRKFSDFNKALVSKIAWNILQKSEKLWCTTLSAKYLKNDVVLVSSLQSPNNLSSKSGSNHGFRQFRTTFQIVLKIPTQIGRPLSETLLIRTATNGNWNSSTKCSLGMLSRKSEKFKFRKLRNPLDRFGLPPSQGNSLPKRHSTPSNKSQLKMIRTQKCLEKGFGALTSTTDSRSSFGELYLTYCQRETETAHHLFLCCPFSEKIWMLSKWQLRLHPISHLSLREWFLEISSKNASFFPDNNIQNEFIIAWAITLELTWKARNDLVHGNEAQNPEQVAQSVLRNTLAHSEARISKKAKPQTNCDWQPPPMNWIKVNCDIALKDDKCFAAFIARDHQSFLIRAETAEIFVYDASFAELRAIRLAAEKFHAKNEDRVIFESDSTEAIKWIK